MQIYDLFISFSPRYADLLTTEFARGLAARPGPRPHGAGQTTDGTSVSGRRVPFFRGCNAAIDICRQHGRWQECLQLPSSWDEDSDLADTDGGLSSLMVQARQVLSLEAAGFL